MRSELECFRKAERLVVAEACYGEQRQEAIHIISNVVFRTLITTSLTRNIILEITINWWESLHPMADTPCWNPCTSAIQVHEAHPSRCSRSWLPRLSVICINIKSAHWFRVRLNKLKHLTWPQLELFFTLLLESYAWWVGLENVWVCLLMLFDIVPFYQYGLDG